MNERNDQKDGPYRVADVKTVWTRIARMLEHLHKLKLVKRPSAELRILIDRLDREEVSDTDDGDISYALEMLAASDAMCASDWLRMKVVEARGRTNVSLHPLDLRGLACRLLVVRFEADDVCHVTVKTQLAGTSRVASVRSAGFANALDGAIRMIGARKEAP